MTFDTYDIDTNLSHGFCGYLGNLKTTAHLKRLTKKEEKVNIFPTVLACTLSDS